VAAGDVTAAEDAEEAAGADGAAGAAGADGAVVPVVDVGETGPACLVVNAKVPETGWPSAEVTRHSTV
jgi:hypothetical protein